MFHNSEEDSRVVLRFRFLMPLGAQSCNTGPHSCERGGTFHFDAQTFCIFAQVLKWMARKDREWYHNSMGEIWCGDGLRFSILCACQKYFEVHFSSYAAMFELERQIIGLRHLASNSLPAGLLLKRHRIGVRTEFQLFQ